MILLALLACKSPGEKAWDHIRAGQHHEAVQDYEQALEQGQADPELLGALAAWTMHNERSGMNLASLGSPGEFEPALEALLYVQHPLREAALLRLFDELDEQVEAAERKAQLANPAGGADMSTALLTAAMHGLRTATVDRVLLEGPSDLAPTLRARYDAVQPAAASKELPPEWETLAQRFEAGDATAQAELLALLDGQPVPLATPAQMDQLEVDMGQQLPNLRTLNEVAAELGHGATMSRCMEVVERIPDPATRSAVYAHLAEGDAEQLGLLARHLARSGDPAGLAQLEQLREAPSWAPYAWIGLHRQGRTEGLDQAYLERRSLTLAALVVEGS